jgi:hypothetical protein
MSWCVWLLVAGAAVCEAALLKASMYESIVYMAQVMRYVESSPSNLSQADDWRAVELFSRPNCPNNASNPIFHCNADGELTRLSLTGRNGQPWTMGLFGAFAWFPEDLPTLTNVTLGNFFGYGLVSTFILIRNGRSLRFTIENCTFYDYYVVEDRWALLFSKSVQVNIRNATFLHHHFILRSLTAVPDSCSFVDTHFQCDVPSELWYCFGDATKPPPCLPRSWDRVEVNDTFIKGRCFTTSALADKQCRVNSCTTPATTNETVFSCILNGDGSANYRPEVPGLATLDLSWVGFGYSYSLTIEQPYTVDIVTRIELFDFDNNSWVRAFDDPVPQRKFGFGLLNRLATLREYPLPRIFTNRFRFTVESLLPDDRIGHITFLRYENTSAVVPSLPALPITCAKPVLLGPRASLDDTIGDSYCVGRVCQDACGDGVAPALVTNVSVGVAVVPVFVVIVGGSGWANGGTPVAESSAGTRVYAIGGGAAANATTLTLSGGVRNATRVRVVSERTASDLGASANATIESTQVHRLLTGRLVQRRRASATYSGGAVVVARDVWPTNGEFAGSVSAKFDAQNASVLAVSATTSVALVYGEVRDGSTDRWQRFDAARNEWTEMVSPLRVLYVNQSTAVAVAIAQRRRVLAHVPASGGSGGLVVVVGASATELYDGTRNGSLAGRRAVQTPVDVYDVARNLWIVGALEHGFDKRMSELDVMVVNGTTTTATVVVTERANGSSSFELEWRPYTTLLRECSEQSACDTCMHTDETLDVCKWCRDVCVPRYAPCMADNSTCAGSIMPSTESTTSATNITSTTITTSQSTGASTTTAESTSTGSAAIATSDSSSGLSSGTVIAIAVPVAIVGVLLLGAAVAVAIVFSRRRRAAKSGTDDKPSAGGIPAPDVELSQQQSATMRGNMGTVERLPDEDGSVGSLSLSE